MYPKIVFTITFFLLFWACQHSQLKKEAPIEEDSIKVTKSDSVIELKNEVAQEKKLEKPIDSAVYKLESLYIRDFYSLKLKHKPLKIDTIKIKEKITFIHRETGFPIYTFRIENLQFYKTSTSAYLFENPIEWKKYKKISIPVADSISMKAKTGTWQSDLLFVNSKVFIPHIPIWLSKAYIVHFNQKKYLFFIESPFPCNGSGCAISVILCFDITNPQIIRFFEFDSQFLDIELLADYNQDGFLDFPQYEEVNCERSDIICDSGIHFNDFNGCGKVTIISLYENGFRPYQKKKNYGIYFFNLNNSTPYPVCVYCKEINFYKP